MRVGVLWVSWAAMSSSSLGLVQPRKIIVGVAGGIAAYKACHLVRNLKEHGDDVRVVPTTNALRFVGAATFEALSGHPVSTEVFDRVDEVQHVRVGQEADAIVVAPATADVIARIAAGRADDLLTATILVATCPVVVVPAMHTEMWHNPATVDNVATLRRRGIVVMEPAHGRLTGKDSGPGRLPEPEQIAQLVRAVLRGAEVTHNWAGRKVVISAGGTLEHLDPVRFLGNSSSGRQGFALAEIAAQRGAAVTVVRGATTQLPVPAGATVVDVVSAREMDAAMREHSQDADVVIMSAAVADYRPAETASSKLKKGSADADLATVHLVENPDILRGLVQAREEGKVPAGAVIVGFAAETGDAEHTVVDLAREKFLRKGCDLLLCNEVGMGRTFGAEDNQGWLLRRAGAGVPNGSSEVLATPVEHGSKLEVAAQILAAVDQFLAGEPA